MCVGFQYQQPRSSHVGGWPARAGFRRQSGRAAGVAAQWGANRARRHTRLAHPAGGPVSPAVVCARVLRGGLPADVPARRLDERLLELFQKGYVKGTVTTGFGNEATAVGMAMPLRPGRDVVSLLHRDFGRPSAAGGHAVSDCSASTWPMPRVRRTPARATPIMATPRRRRFPMISHLGKMPSLVVGGTWAARRQGEDVFGLAVIGDGGSSTGENPRIAQPGLGPQSARAVPDREQWLLVLHAHELPVPLPAAFRSGRRLRHCRPDDRRHRRVGGLHSVCDALEAMQATSLPLILECMTLRLHGHAAYDKGEYVPAEQMRQWRARDPLPAARQKLLRSVRHVGGRDRRDRAGRSTKKSAGVWPRRMAVGRVPTRSSNRDGPAYSPRRRAGRRVKPCVARRGEERRSGRPGVGLPAGKQSPGVPFGLDVGVYGSAFKTCKGLIERHGAERVLDMPICESAWSGFALGASQVGGEPIIEFQFADFSTEVGHTIGPERGHVVLPHRAARAACCCGCPAAAG